MWLLPIKLLLTLVVGVALVYPFVRTTPGAGVLSTVESIGTVAIVSITISFLIAVAFYCRTLQRCLRLVRPTARAAEPKSVWYMFLIPYNFVEDFFIVHNVTRSLQAEAALNPALTGMRRFGAFSGFGWCVAQIVSLLPNRVGEIAGVVALVLWGIHWAFIHRINKRLEDSQVIEHIPLSHARSHLANLQAMLIA